MSHRFRIVATLIAVIIASALVAQSWMRTPALWPPVPNGAWRLLSDFVGVRSQEDIALVEFAVFWVLTVVLLALAWLAARCLCRILAVRRHP